eukprot:Sspe_Gene.60340::Locus_33247_Transcript_1_2_Confidence_0.750_Length_2000::g.60340::m.60340
MKGGVMSPQRGLAGLASPERTKAAAAIRLWVFVVCIATFAWVGYVWTWRRDPPPVVGEVASHVAIVVVVKQPVFPSGLFADYLTWRASQEAGNALSMVIVISSSVRNFSIPSHASAQQGVTVVHPTCEDGAWDCRVSYRSLANLGVSRINALATHVLLISGDYEVHHPKSTRSPSLPDALRAALRPAVGVAGCTLAVPRESGLEVLSHGVDVGTGHGTDGEKFFMLKRYAGLHHDDGRVREHDPVVAVSPYCMMVRTALWHHLNGFRDFLHHEVLGESVDAFGRTVGKLKKMTVILTALLDTAPTDKLSTEDLRGGYTILSEAVSLLEEIGEGVDIRAESKETEFRTELQVEVRRVTTSHGGDKERLEGVLEETAGLIKGLREADRVKGPVNEEEVAWDLCLRVRQRQLSVVVVPVVLKRVLSPHGHLAPDRPSYAVEGRFGQVWRRHIKYYGPAAARDGLRVLWQSFCCKCCGFVNEITHLVVPLQHMHAVSLIPGPECFCKGFPPFVTDTLRRLHLPVTDYMQPTMEERKQITVWISHTDPGSYYQEPLEVRPADYVV